MLNKLSLTNFQKHEELVIGFTAGLNAIRGANENGKSSLMRAIAYAFFGSRALPMSLEETVTWGKPVATLKVELTFTHAGKQFKIVRKKSGAELTSDGVVASGQSEVTSFVEKLFGASAAIAQATALTNQAALQDGLDSSAMSLIEKLANMSLIDELIGKVQTKLPSGSTKGVEAQLSTVASTEMPTLDTAGLEQTIADLAASKSSAAEMLAAVQSHLAGVESLANSGQQKQSANKTAEALKTSLSSQLAGLQTQLHVPPFEAPDINALEKEVSLASEVEAVNRAWAKFQSLPTAPAILVSDYDSKLRAANADVASASSTIADLRVRIATLNSSRITESACGLCGKDLSEIPEVVSKNSEIDGKVRSLLEKLEQESEILGTAKAEHTLLGVYQLQASKLRAYFPIRFVELSEEFIPPKAKWVGPSPQEDIKTDWAAELAKAKLAIARHSKAVQTAEIAQKQITEIEARLGNVQFHTLDDAEVKAMLELGDLRAKVNAALKQQQTAAQEYNAAVASLDKAKAVYAVSVESWEAGQLQRKQLVELLSNYHFNNGIISKLREARPAVAAKLWALVLAGVSHYFSQIRGVSSTVTRGEKGFMIDGKSVEAFSGSAKDSLGLAIRLMLQKTFLPNVSFMLADEPGAACDGARESDMLATLAGSGLDQVILVTHSDLADTFASNVIVV